jgi:hypothetical protein
MSPNPALLPCPAGQPPLKLTEAATSLTMAAPGTSSHTVSAQQCGFGRGVASGPQVSVALPALRPVAPTGSIAAAMADSGTGATV